MADPLFNVYAGIYLLTVLDGCISVLPELSELIQVTDTCQYVINKVLLQFYKCVTSPTRRVSVLLGQV